MKKRVRVFSTLLVVLAGMALAVSGLSADSISRLGEIRYDDGGRGGDSGPPAREVGDGELVRCLSHGAVIRLDNGQVLRLDSNSSAILEGDESGRVTVRVLSGRVTMIGPGGRVGLAGAGSTFDASPTLDDPVAAEELLLQHDPRTGKGDRRRGR